MAGLVCYCCERQYSLDEPLWKCECGSLLDIQCEARFPLEEIKGRSPTLWRYRESIPVTSDGNVIFMGEGFTPMVEEDLGGVPVCGNGTEGNAEHYGSRAELKKGTTGI